MEKAKRYNKGKIRYELIPQSFLEHLSKVYTMGAEKYSYVDDNGNFVDGSENWKKGLDWKSMLGSTMRHLEKFRAGEDFDYDWPDEIIKKYGPSLHLANAAWNLSVLIEYYKIHPELDNRDHFYLKNPKIGLDIDEVIADWVGHWTKHHGQLTPEFWSFDRNIKEKFDLLKDNKEFWMSIPPKIDPKSMPFEPHCYITSRSIPNEWTEEWIEKMGFPTKPVYTVPHNVSKVDTAKSLGIEWFVDDRYENFLQLNQAGICCWLMDAPHNSRYDVGFKRIRTLKDLVTGGFLNQKK